MTGAALSLLGALTLIESAAGVSLGIDELVFTDWTGGHAPGRMGLNTAACFSLLGGAYVVSGFLNRGIGFVVVPLAVPLLSIAAAALVGYMTGLELAYSWGGVTRMAIHTAVGFALIIALTAGAGARDADNARAAGCTEHLSKPVSKRALLTAVDRVAGGSAADTAVREPVLP